jgi:hypothetical protein
MTNPNKTTQALPSRATGKTATPLIGASHPDSRDRQQPTTMVLNTTRVFADAEAIEEDASSRQGCPEERGGCSGAACA